MLGLESIFDIDEHQSKYLNWEKDKMFAVLKGESYNIPAPVGIPLKNLLLRARVNTHRMYEIYQFSSSMTIDEIKTTFNSDSVLLQDVVNWIRTNGYKVYSDYEPNFKRVIQ